MSDTPRTDAAPWTFMEAGYHPNVQRWVKIEFARELERENAALREDKARLDSGMIQIREMDEMGDFVPCIHSGMDLRAAIDAARKEAQP